jgi:hypothetical protein
MQLSRRGTEAGSEQVAALAPVDDGFEAFERRSEAHSCPLKRMVKKPLSSVARYHGDFRVCRSSAGHQKTPVDP